MSLDAAALARKERLSQLKSLKRKQASSTQEDRDTPSAPDFSSSTASPPSPTSRDVSHLLSGRNYDAADRAPKMGFVTAPNEGQTTVEDIASKIAEQTLEQRKKEEQEDKPIDLFNLQPKRPNWDLKRDVEKKVEMLKGKTDAAIATLVRRRIEEEKAKKKGVTKEEEAGEVEGNIAKLVEEREKEREEERREEERETAEE